VKTTSTPGCGSPIAAGGGLPYYRTDHWLLEDIMAWTTPTLVEICIGLEINGYLPAEF
jgi:coenzyme PQQ precursor peptide PqqA